MFVYTAYKGGGRYACRVVYTVNSCYLHWFFSVKVTANTGPLLSGEILSEIPMSLCSRHIV